VEEMLALVGLAGYGHRMPHELSGGQQQRVALARALAPEPALVLLDEPFSALDTSLRASVRADVRSALEAAGATAVLVTHDQQEALSMADQVAVMRDGRIVQAASPDDLYARPADLDVATFVGEAVILPASLSGEKASCLLGNLPVHNLNGERSGTGSVVLRPEQLVVTEPGAGIHAKVLGVEFFGHDALVSLAIPGASEAVRARTLGRQRLAVDDEVGVTVDGSVSFFPK
jgi:iron(III) transport system ATP-binding protein